MVNFDYDKAAADNGWYPEVLFGLAWPHLGPGRRLLDVGVGTGLASDPFLHVGMTVSGFDSDEDMLAECRRRRPAIDLLRHDLTKLPWPYDEHSFDVVLVAGVFHFFPDIVPWVREAARLCRPEGALAFVTKGGSGQGLTRTRIQGTDIYEHSAELVGSAATSAGLSLVKEHRFLARTGRGTHETFHAYLAVPMQ